MKTAIVYDRVNKWGGAERLLKVLHEMFPDAPLYTSVYDSKSAQWASVFPEIHTTFLQNIPFAKNNHEYLAPLMPVAFESFNFDKYDLVISVTSEAAKGIITKPGTRHVCYLLTPTRYLWSGYNDYFKGRVERVLTRPIVKYLRSWDKIAAQRPDKLVTISTTVQNRVKKYYKRDSEVVYPPNTFTKARDKDKMSVRKDYYLAVGRLVPYKRFDLIVDVFNDTGQRLLIIGKGSEEKKLKDMANNNIKFAGEVSEKKLITYYKEAKALVFPQVEDFGLVAVEAQSFGTPVIAFNEGGATETVKEGLTGTFFHRQTKRSLKKAIGKFEKMKFNEKRIIDESKIFSKLRFKEKFLKAIK